MNRKLRGRARIRFANPADVHRLNRPKLLAAQRKRDSKPSADLNPAMPGCMVSRIRLKQATRAAAYNLVAAEAALANASWSKNSPAAPPADLALAWQLVALNQFHDAITGTHIDNANRELHDMLEEADSIAARYFRIRPVRLDIGRLAPMKSSSATLMIGKLRVSFDRFGITAIVCSGRNLFAVEKPKWNNTSRDLRIGELVLEPDYGDPWGGVRERDERKGPVHVGRVSKLAERDHFESFVARESVRFLNNYGRSHPFFLISSYLKPHDPFMPPERFANAAPST